MRLKKGITSFNKTMRELGLVPGFDKPKPLDKLNRLVWTSAANQSWDELVLYVETFGRHEEIVEEDDFYDRMRHIKSFDVETYYDLEEFQVVFVPEFGDNFGLWIETQRIILDVYKKKK